jgi:nitrogen fixation protein NifU and related proteins
MTETLYAKDLLRWAADVSHAGQLPQADAAATESNPMCGDRCHMAFAAPDGVIAEARHETRACALTQASASILTAHAAGETAMSVSALRAEIANMLTGAAAPSGKWSVYGLFAGAAAHKSRHTCVLLPLDAAVKALGPSHTSPKTPG